MGSSPIPATWKRKLKRVSFFSLCARYRGAIVCSLALCLVVIDSSGGTCGNPAVRILAVKYCCTNNRTLLSYQQNFVDSTTKTNGHYGERTSLWWQGENQERASALCRRSPLLRIVLCMLWCYGFAVQMPRRCMSRLMRSRRFRKPE